MFVRWQRRDERRWTTNRFVYMYPTADEYAVLVESARVNSKPRQRHVAYLGSYHDDPRDFIPLHWRNGHRPPPPCLVVAPYDRKARCARQRHPG
jgi:hypothetical protein